MSSSDVARLVFGYLSDQGLEKSKVAFSKESPDLVGSDVDNSLNLSLIIEEYFYLKGNDKKLNLADSESILLSLWKHFDILVGQLKHSTIYNANKVKSKRKYTDQRARVRELNKKNWASLQKQNNIKSSQLVNVAQNNGITDASRVTQPSTRSKFVQIRPNPCHGGIEPPPKVSTTAFQSSYKMPNLTVHSSCPNVLSNVLATPTKNTLPLPGNVLSESIRELDSSVRNEQLHPVEQLKSPKRKSVPPRKRTGEHIPSSAQHSTKANVVTSFDTNASDDGTLDLKNIVDKILEQPNLPEKLAENINRAVEIDVPSSQHPRTEMENGASTGQSAVVDSEKVEDILDMMKSDPIFQELFSSFENFEGNRDEPDIMHTKTSEAKTSSAQSSSGVDECAHVALDALLMLASSPSRSTGSLQTPAKTQAPVLSSTEAPVTPVILSPGVLSPVKRQPIISHVRQLNFAGNEKPAGSTSQAFSAETALLGMKQTDNGKFKLQSSKGGIPTRNRTNRGTSRGMGKSAEVGSFEHQTLRETRSSTAVMSEVSGAQSSQNSEVILVGESGSGEAPVCCGKKGDRCEKLNFRENVNDIIMAGEEEVEGGKEEGATEQEGVKNSRAVSQSQGNISGEENLKRAFVGEVEMTGKGFDLKICNVEISENVPEKLAEAKESQDFSRKVTGTEDLTVVVDYAETCPKTCQGQGEICDGERTIANKETTTATREENVVHVCQSGLDKSIERSRAASLCETTDREIERETSASKEPMSNEAGQGSSLKTNNVEGFRRTIDTIVCEPITAEPSGGITSLAEGFSSFIGGFTSIKSPLEFGKDVSTPTGSDKTLKRKKKKKSGKSSKKTKVIPKDLDVDQFLSRLHYVNEGET